jgi:arabinose-5-phosphate isomerase
MLKNLLDESRRHLNSFFESLDIKRFEEVVQMCMSCKGFIIFTGVGKSGIIAEKTAMTLISTGTKALYLPPMNFLHGDIGIVSENDLLVMISKSGETEELLNLVPFIQRRKAKILALVSNPVCRLAKCSDLSMYLPVEKELCSFDLVPTTSTAVQLIFGDVLAVALMKARNFNMSDYVLNHPAGSIGKKMTLTVKDVMLGGDQVPFCKPQDRLVDVLVELSNKKCGALLVVDEQRRLQGIFTDGDLRRALQMNGSRVLEQNMAAIMTASAICVSSDMLAWDAMKHMQKDPKKWVMVTPVIENHTVVGILRMHDIVQAGIS